MFLNAVCGRENGLISLEQVRKIRDNVTCFFENVLESDLGDEGILFSTQDSLKPKWFLKVAHAGHNDLEDHQVVQDAIISWLSL